MGSSFCWIKLKDASVQFVGPINSLMERTRPGGGGAESVGAPALTPLVPAGCNPNSTLTALSADVRHTEVTTTCKCCSRAPMPKIPLGWGGRFADSAPTPIHAGALAGGAAVTWRLEGPSHRGELPNQDHTMTLSPSFDDRAAALAWLRSADGSTWSADAIGLTLIAHLDA
jgi:hypothetical protein